MDTLAIGATGMAAQQLNVDTISNNIANMTTTGYKGLRAEFADLLPQNLQMPGSATSDTNTIAPSGITLGRGVKAIATYRTNQQGTIQQTSNPLDLAIQGTGYFQVQLPNGQTAYTRDGTLQLNAQGQIVTAEGYTVLPSITIPNNVTAITINSSGQISASVPGQTTLQNLGQLQIASFVNPAGLQDLGENLFQETDASGNATTGNPGTEQFGTLLQGALEQSNVNIVSEMTNLISAQRAYEMNSKVIKAGDDMMQTVSQSL
jgi:flagellar basal-body rod protein FlgG